MASRCKTCENAIMNAEFITCNGLCGELFHTKCVGLSKSMLTAVTNCPNMHWFCHDCNNENMNVSFAMDGMKKAIDRLASSLSSDLLQFLNGFKVLMDKLFETIGTVSHIHGAIKVVDSQSDKPVTKEVKNIVTSISHEKPIIGTNVKDMSIAVTDVALEPTNSVVVSNIGKEVPTDCLTNFLADVLKIDQSKIKLSLLLPAGQTLADVQFVQYKVTVPKTQYKAIIDPSTWPENVRVRDFVYKPRKGVGVTLEKFLEKNSHTHC